MSDKPKNSSSATARTAEDAHMIATGYRVLDDIARLKAEARNESRAPHVVVIEPPTAGFPMFFVAVRT